jgi:hypothetical protein
MKRIYYADPDGSRRWYVPEADYLALLARARDFDEAQRRLLDLEEKHLALQAAYTKLQGRVKQFVRPYVALSRLAEKP